MMPCWAEGGAAGAGDGDWGCFMGMGGPFLWRLHDGGSTLVLDGAPFSLSGADSR